jgi:hypothetical protein
MAPRPSGSSRASHDLKERALLEAEEGLACAPAWANFFWEGERE